jgi:hypothetical protein
VACGREDILKMFKTGDFVGTVNDYESDSDEDLA